MCPVFTRVLEKCIYISNVRIYRRTTLVNQHSSAESEGTAAVSLLPTNLILTTTDPEALGTDHTGKVRLWRPQPCLILRLTTKPNNLRTRPAILAQLLAQICPVAYQSIA